MQADPKEKWTIGYQVQDTSKANTSTEICNEQSEAWNRIFERALQQRQIRWLETTYSALQKNLTFGGFSYKMPIDARVENYPKIMINASVFVQMIALTWEASS